MNIETACLKQGVKVSHGVEKRGGIQTEDGREDPRNRGGKRGRVHQEMGLGSQKGAFYSGRKKGRTKE